MNIPGDSSTPCAGRAPARRRVAQGFEQHARIALDRLHGVLREQLRERALEQVAVLEHVGNTARHAAVVFEHEVVARVVADQVGADDVREDVLLRQDTRAARGSTRAASG